MGLLSDDTVEITVEIDQNLYDQLVTNAKHDRRGVRNALSAANTEGVEVHTEPEVEGGPHTYTETELIAYLIYAGARNQTNRL